MDLDVGAFCYTVTLSLDRIPTLKADKRKGFIYNRSLSVLTWAICLLSVSEIISSYLRIPITSTLAFGGIGGLAIGLAGKVRGYGVHLLQPEYCIVYVFREALVSRSRRFIHFPACELFKRDRRQDTFIGGGHVWSCTPLLPNATCVKAR